jgi:hypothetical protein
MKSYFAKLAARAAPTVAAPINPSAPPQSDPFEDSAGVDSSGSTGQRLANVTIVARPPAITNSKAPTVSESASEEIVVANAPQEFVKRVTLSEKRSAPNAEPARNLQAPPLQPPAEAARAAFSPLSIEAKEDSSVSAPRRTHALDISGIKELQAEGGAADEPEVIQDPSPIATSSGRADAPHAELLRRADDFMGGLVPKLAAEPRAEDSSSLDERQNEQTFRPAETASADARFQPRSPSSPISHGVDEVPSVIIGNLIVEVTPPVPPPLSARRMPSGRITRGGFRLGTRVPSARRFGLSQF